MLLRASLCCALSLLCGAGAVVAQAPAADGRVLTIVFVGYVSDPSDWDLYRINSDGSGLRRLTDRDAVESRPDISPDGTKIAYRVWERGADEPYQIRTMNADGSADQRVLGDTAPIRCGWSPDGARLVVASSRERALLAVGPDGSRRRAILAREGLKGMFPRAPRWSPDGSRIVFEAWPEGEGEGRQAIYVCKADGTDLRELVAPDARRFAPDWSPDGSRIVFWRSDAEPPEIWIINADGTGRHRVPNIWGGDPRWSPDGERILYNGVWPRGIHSARPDGTDDRVLVMNPWTTSFDVGWCPPPQGEGLPLWLDEQLAGAEYVPLRADLGQGDGTVQEMFIGHTPLAIGTRLQAWFGDWQHYEYQRSAVLEDEEAEGGVTTLWFRTSVSHERGAIAASEALQTTPYSIDLAYSVRSQTGFTAPFVGVHSALHHGPLAGCRYALLSGIGTVLAVGTIPPTQQDKLVFLTWWAPARLVVLLNEEAAVSFEGRWGPTERMTLQHGQTDTAPYTLLAYARHDNPLTPRMQLGAGLRVESFPADLAKRLIEAGPTDAPKQ